jgi:zinc transport system substrate-binding protein
MNFKKISILVLLISLIGLVFFLSARSQPSNQSSNQNSDQTKTIFVSIWPYEILFKNANNIKVDILGEGKIDIHDYQIRTDEIIKIQKSDLLIYNKEYDDQINNVIKSQNIDSKKLINVIDLIDKSSLIKGGEIHHDEHADEEKNELEKIDPHFWTSPKTFRNILENMVPKLKESNISFNQANLDELKIIDEEFSKTLKNCKLDTVVTSHEAFAYLGRDYNFKIETLSGLNPNDEKSLQEIAEITKEVKEKNIKYFLSDDTLSENIYNGFVTDLNLQTLTINNLELKGENSDYFEIQRKNLENLKKALEC